MRNTFNIDFSTYVFIDEIKVSQDNTYLLAVMPSDVLYAKLLYLTFKKMSVATHCIDFITYKRIQTGSLKKCCSHSFRQIADEETEAQSVGKGVA